VNLINLVDLHLEICQRLFAMIVELKISLLPVQVRFEQNLQRSKMIFNKTSIQERILYETLNT